MTKNEIKEELRFIDSSIVEAIIECCKHLYCQGIPLYEWNYDLVMECIDKALQDWEE